MGHILKGIRNFVLLFGLAWVGNTWADTINLTSSPNPSSVGQAVHLKVKVDKHIEHSKRSDAEITIYDGGTIIERERGRDIEKGVTHIRHKFNVSGVHILTATIRLHGRVYATSPAVKHVVKSSTATSLTSGTNPSALGQAVTLTATVSGSSPTGSVIFKDGATVLGTSAIASGQATLSVTFNTAGRHRLTASYEGDANNIESDSPAIKQSVISTTSSTTTTLTSDINPSALGQSVILTAKVTGSSPTGTVTFKDGGTVLGAGSLVAGVATFSTTFSTAGTHNLTASYAGDANNATSLSAPLVQVVKSTIASTSTTLTSSANPSALGQVVSLTATVTGVSPTGIVTFKDGATVLGTGTLAAGKATFNATFSSAGTHNLTASYAGDANNATSTSVAVTQTVNIATSTTTLSSVTNPSVVGQTASLSATVTGVAPTGTVTFKDGTTVLGVATIAAGTATFSAIFNTVGTHNLTAEYSGDTNNAASSSVVVAQTVNIATSGTELSVTPNPSSIGKAVALTATVTGVAPTGSVTFKDGATVLGTGTLAAGTATFSATFNVTGTHNLTAIYAGDANNATSTSTAVVQTVNAATSSTVLTGTPNPSAAGQAVVLKATVTGASPTGTVTFMDGATVLGTGTLAAGSATLNHTFSVAGIHSLTASYAGDANNAASASLALEQTVNLATSSIDLTAMPSPSEAGQTVSLTATVTGAAPTGMVTFKDGMTVLGTSTLAAGTATFNTSINTAGAHNLTASYSGDTNNSTSASTVVAHTVNVATSSTVLTATPAPSDAGQLVSLTATVTGFVPTGTVIFRDGTTVLGTGTLAAGTATFSATFSLAGAHNLTASYSGDANNAASTSQVVTQTVNTAASTITLSSNTTPSVVGQTVNLIATVTGATPSGTVTFKDGATVLGVSTIAAGKATFSVIFNTVGAHSLTAEYSGDTNNTTSVSNGIVQTINIAPSNTILSAVPSPSTVGQAVALTATVTGAVPTGTVTFKDGAIVLGTSPLAAGTATFSAIFDTTGTHDLTAIYAGDANNATSTSIALVQTVNHATSSTALTAMPGPSEAGQTVSLTATVTGVSPTGTVTFKNGATVLGTSTLAAGSATLSYTFASVGTYGLTAVYAGDANNTASTSVVVAQVVNTSITTTTLTSGANPSESGQIVALTATVTGATPSGTVTFKDGATVLGTATINAGQATYNAIFNAAGVHSLTAIYGGDANNATSTSTAVAQTVNTATSSTVLSATPNPSVVGQSVSLTATVTGVSPTGIVTFKDGTTVLGTGTLAAGKATFNATFSSAGTHNLTASYAGDANNATSTSVAVTQTVSIATSTTTLTSGTNPSVVGQTVSLTATVTGVSPTGIVTFKDGATVLGTGTPAAGTVTFNATFSSAGAHNLTAIYAGDANNAPSSSTAVAQTVNIATSGTELSVTPNPSSIGKAVALTATVTGVAPTGSVTFKDGATVLGTGTLAAGTATFSATFNVTGTHNLTAIYAGDANNATSTSTAVAQTVNTATSSTVLTGTPNPSAAGQAVVLKATVTGVSPTGTVTFMDGATVLGTGTLVAGSATLSHTFSVAGIHNLTASYAGDAKNTPSTSSALMQSVTIQSSITLVSNINPLPVGQAVVLTATVTGISPTGTITFKDGATVLGTAPVTAGAVAMGGGAYSTGVTAMAAIAATGYSTGVATLTYTFSTTGAHRLTAVYSGDFNNAPSFTPSTITQTVYTPSSAQNFGVAPNPSTVGQAVSLSVTITGASTAPSGTVTFMDGGVAIGTANLVHCYPDPKWGQFCLVAPNVNNAMISYTFNTAGVHYLTAVYAGDASNPGGTSAVVAQTVNSIASTITLVSGLNPSSAGQVVTLIANVAGVAPTGTVTFKDGAIVLGAAAVAAGKATISNTFTTVGTHSLTAVYAGDANNKPSTSAVVVQTVNSSPITTTLTSSLNPSVVGQVVTLTTNVTGASPTGVVTFKDGTTVLGTGTLVAGTATLSYTFNTAGVHSLTAVYAGDANNAAGTSSALAQSVSLKPTTATLVSGINPSGFQSVGLTATVAGFSPTGTITFKDGATALGTVAVSAGTASFTANFNTAGTHSLTAEYSGDANNTPSISSGVAQTVYSSSSAMSFGTSPNPSSVGQVVDMSVTITGASIAPTGKVTFMDGGVVIGTANLVHCSIIIKPGTGLPMEFCPVAANINFAPFSFAFNTAGVHNLTAVYAGDANNPGGTSSAVAQVVNINTTSTTLTSNLNPSTAGQTVILNAAIAGVAPTGTVTFKDGATVLGAATVAAGKAALSIAINTVGVHNLTAVYSGDANNAASISAALAQTVNVGISTTMLTSSATPSGLGQSVALTATVTGGSPTGNVTFRDGATVLGTATVIAGQATLNYTFNALGAHGLTATYAGDVNNAGSTSAAITQTVVNTISATALATDINPSDLGQTVTLTATVTGAAPAGTVTFKDGTTVLGTSAIAAGQGTLNFTFNTAGAHSLTAVYAGDANNSTSSSATVAQTVNKSTSITALTTSINPANAGQAITLSAAILGTTPSGTVTFMDGASVLGAATITAGQATLNYTFVAVGTHNLTAVYAGDTNNLASTSTAVVQTINIATSTTALTVSSSLAIPGETIGLTATVTGALPNGTVTFMDGATVLGAVTVAAGKATLNTAFSTVGVHSLTANYGGDANNSASTSTVVTLTVAAEKITFFHNDVAGTPMVATDAAGALLWKESYRPYGDPMQPPVADNNIWFSGKPYDKDTGLTYMGARYYDPLIGRFTGIDPVGFKEDNLHSFNRYAYGNNNPNKYLDPNGQKAVKIAFTQFYLYTGNGVAKLTSTPVLTKKHPGLTELTPTMQEAAKLTLVEMEGRGWKPKFVESPLRTPEQQAEKVSSGVSKTLNSKHLDQGGEGSGAMDIMDKRWGQVDNTKEQQRFFRELGEVGKENNLIWGGDFGSKNSRTNYGWDPAHLEQK